MTGFAGEIAVVNDYVLAAGSGAFLAATGALARRVLAEGHPGVLSYRFFASADGARGAANVLYADAGAWIGHHEIAMAWPEMKALHRVARLQAITFLGTVTPEIEAWLAASGLAAEIRSFPVPAGGFRRQAAGAP